MLAILASSFWVFEINSDVNLRKGPDNKKKVLTTVPAGQTIEMLEETNQWWWKVKYKGKTGYIASSFISRSYTKTFLQYAKKEPTNTALAVTGLLIFFLILLRKASGGSKPKTKGKKK